MHAESYRPRTAADQHRQYGCCVEARDGDVYLQVGDEVACLDPDQARRFTYWWAAACYQADQQRARR